MQNNWVLTVHTYEVNDITNDNWEAHKALKKIHVLCDSIWIATKFSSKFRELAAVKSMSIPPPLSNSRTRLLLDFFSRLALGFETSFLVLLHWLLFSYAFFARRIAWIPASHFLQNHLRLGIEVRGGFMQ